MNDLLTTSQAAERIGLNTRTVQKMIKNRQIHALKIGGFHFVTKDEIDRYAIERRKPGRPRKRTN